MSIDSTPHRWGMGPSVDPGFAARVERIAAAPERQAREEAWLSGYIEFVDAEPLASLRALLAQIYAQAASNAHEPSKARTLVAEIRYLTTDPACGIALPMSSFMPPRAGKPSEPQHGTFFEAALAQLHKATQDRLKKAKRLSLTVAFDLEVIAGQLRPLFSPDPEVRRRNAELRWTDADMQLALFGERARARRFGVQKIGLAGGFTPQLARAERLLQTPAAATPQSYGITQTGQNTIVGIVDFGCDFAHPSFRVGAKGTRSRILALWDQNESNAVPGAPPVVDVNGVPCGFGFGRFFSRSAIEASLAQWQATAPPDPAGPTTTTQPPLRAAPVARMGPTGPSSWRSQRAVAVPCLRTPILRRSLAASRPMRTSCSSRCGYTCSRTAAVNSTWTMCCMASTSSSRWPRATGCPAW